MKRKTKAEREAGEMAALERRIRDIARGAHGGFSMNDDPENEEFFGYANDLGVEAFGRYLAALKFTFAENTEDVSEVSPGKVDSCWFDVDEIHHYDRPDEAAAYLYEKGARA